MLSFEKKRSVYSWKSKLGTTISRLKEFMSRKARLGGADRKERT
jgi:hypothetical protein